MERKEKKKGEKKFYAELFFQKRPTVLHRHTALALAIVLSLQSATLYLYYTPVTLNFLYKAWLYNTDSKQLATTINTEASSYTVSN